MARKNSSMSKKITDLLAEIQSEHDAVELSPWNLTLEEMMKWDKEESDWDRGKRDYTEIDIWNASNYKEFNEANLGSVYKHWLDGKLKSFTMITAYVSTSAKTIAASEQIKHNNKVNFSRLKSDLSGYGYFDVLGYSEATVDGKKVVITEPTLFVNNLPLQQAMTLARRYKQWGIVYCGPETKGNVRIFFTSGTNKDIGQFHPGKLTTEYSTIRGKPFVFEAVLPVSGFVSSSWYNHTDIKEIPGVRKARKYISKSIGFK